MNLSDSTDSVLTREQKIVNLFAMLDELRGQQKIASWLRLHEHAQIWFSQVDGQHVCVVIDEGRQIGKGRGEDRVEAEKQAFSVVFLNEALADAP